MSNSLSIADITRLINSILADYSQDEDLSVRLPHLSELTELGDTPRFALERVLEKLDALKERLAQVQIENDLRIKAQRSAGDE